MPVPTPSPSSPGTSSAGASAPAASLSTHSHSPPVPPGTVAGRPADRGPRLGARRADLRADLQASLVVFLIAMPLSLGIAVATGAPVAAGLIAAVVGGIVAGALGGVCLQVSGPAAGLTVVVAGLISTYGWRVTCAVTAAAGVVQILFGVSRVARAALAVSPAIVHGMLGGIGFTIAVGQLHVILGGEPDSHAIHNIMALPGRIVVSHSAATLIGAITIAVLVLWPWLVRGLPGGLRAIPGPLAAVVVGTALAAALHLDLPRVDLPGSIISSVSLPVFPDRDWPGVILGVLTIAIVASVESLLSAVAVEKLAAARGRVPGRISLDRELLGQGAANVLSGLAGGLPVTGVIVRGSANVAAGARTRASAVLHGVWVALFAVFLGGVVRWIPLSALAGLLVVVGVRLMDVSHLRHVRRHGELPVYVATLVGVVALDLLQGVVLGMLTALALVLRRVLWSNIHLVQTGETWRVDVEGTLSFLSLPRLARVLGRVPSGACVSIELVVDYLDHAAFEHLHTWCAEYERTGGQVSVDEIGHAWFRRPRADQSHRRRTVVPHLPRWFAPWSQWQELAASHGEAHRAAAPVTADGSPDTTGTVDVADGHVHPVGTMLVGVAEFHRRAAPLLRGTLGDLADGQRPSALFLTCVDSRVVPNIITSSGPGDLFTVRNVGNIVPLVSSDGTLAGGPTGDLSVTAALDYAIDTLRVPSIVVCGHSGCGAMTALLSGGIDRDPDSALAGWLTHARGALARTPLPGTETLSPLEQLGRANVVLQLEHLRGHPAVRRALARGPLELVGLYFDIPAAHTWVLDEASGRFVDPSDALAAVLPQRRRPPRRWDTPAAVTPTAETAV
ncbi:bifunctional SulP family inorganic anion transporter/carbonic anhydrase [Frankia sp. CiP3]|uniref:bifunctional SulP family inorganic anion transporter/carbonic anhydrase n=1 Tax=Frankia sp. CiP3 TaxID=2880971 RepID=UPI001EF5BC7E|nr:bifunctional SulP family inorganic anion transporter/carbonic anhydrase [Frankia sp. CiP3]